MSSEQCVDNGEICQNCAEIITEALPFFILAPLAEGHGSSWGDQVLKGKRRWQTRDIKRILSEDQSSCFGSSPLECYVCFRSSQLVKTGGVKQVKLWLNGPKDGIDLQIIDEAESQSVWFTLTFSDGKKTFTYITRLMSDNIRLRNIHRR